MTTWTYLKIWNQGLSPEERSQVGAQMKSHRWELVVPMIIAAGIAMLGMGTLLLVYTPGRGPALVGVMAPAVLAFVPFLVMSVRTNRRIFQLALAELPFPICPSCGYDLRATPGIDVCPECGLERPPTAVETARNGGG